MMSEDVVRPRPNTEVRWEWIPGAWEMFTKNPGTWVGLLLLLIIIMLVVIGVPFFLILIPAGILSAGRDGGAGIAAATGMTLLLIPVVMILGLLVSSFLFSGAFRAAIKQARGEAISVGDLFSGGDSFLRVLGVLVVSALVQIVVFVVFAMLGTLSSGLGVIGSLINFLAGATINGILFFAIPLIVDRRIGVMEAITTSVETTKSQWWMFAIFAFVLQLLSGIGAIVCGIGMLVTYPFYFLTPAVAYRDTFGLRGAQSYDPFRTPSAPPSYWGAPSVADLTPTMPIVDPSSSVTMFCPACGAEILRDAKFCNRCGHSL